MEFWELEQFDYVLPERLIRKQGVEPRDSARLFVYDTATDTVTLDTFTNLAKYLPPESLLVLNDTRVVPARLWLTKETGGKIEVFVLANELQADGLIPVLVDRKVVVGQKIIFPDKSFFEVVEQQENRFFMKLSSQKTLWELLDTYGETPVPHYLEEKEKKNEAILRERYQTTFAKATQKLGASVAAPTASLHFTQNVFESLEAKNITTTKITLDVGLGTFAPLREEHFQTNKLHPEHVVISEASLECIHEAKAQGQSVVTIGTTATRALEAYFAQDQCQRDFVADIFITPPYHFQATDILITNFHLPKSSLMLLVQAFLAHKGAKRNLVDLYQEAIANDFSFYSFGDSMLIL